MKLQEFLNLGFDNGCVDFHLSVHRTPHGVTKVALRGSGHYDLECDGVAVDSEIVIFDNPRVE